MFTDIHSHILHSIDDGPENFEQSVMLLNEAVKGGVKKIIAVPHFYASRHGLEERLSLAKARYSELQGYISQNNIPVSLLLGFEVRYFNGISRIDSLNKLCINGSKVLLLELGASPITQEVVEEILDLSYSGYKVVLAHIERYTKISGFKRIKPLITAGEVIVQCNADSFLSGHFRRVAHSLLKKNAVSLIASDMHSVELRPPNLKQAYEAIENKFGTNVKNRLLLNCEKVFDMCLKK